MADTPGLSPVYPTWQEGVRFIATTVNRILQGKVNATGTVTLTANATTTTVTDSRVTESSFIGFMPETANAAAEIAATGVGAGGMWVSARTQATSFVITHENNAQTDRDFTYVVIG